MKSNEYIGKFINTIDHMDSMENDRKMKISGIVMSEPGYGKTTVYRMYSEFKGYNYMELVPSESSHDEILGYQCNNGTGHGERLVPSWYWELGELAKNGKRTLLFVDEITTCDEFLQGPLLKVVLERKIDNSHYLHDNVFVCAAGNYTENLNNAFKMTPALVNRFAILNLRLSDFSIADVVDNEIGNLKTEEEYRHFLGLDEDCTAENPYWDIEALKTWFKTSGDIGFGRGRFEEDETFGLLGFTSPRSLGFTRDFAEEYFKHYSDNLWTRVVGDTLGRSAKRGDSVTLAQVIESYSDMFKKKVSRGADSEEDFSSVLKDIVKNCSTLTMKEIGRIKKAAATVSSDDITSTDLSNLTKVGRLPLDSESPKVVKASFSEVKDSILKKVNSRRS